MYRNGDGEYCRNTHPANDHHTKNPVASTQGCHHMSRDQVPSLNSSSFHCSTYLSDDVFHPPSGNNTSSHHEMSEYESSFPSSSDHGPNHDTQHHTVNPTLGANPRQPIDGASSESANGVFVLIDTSLRGSNSTPSDPNNFLVNGCNPNMRIQTISSTTGHRKMSPPNLNQDFVPSGSHGVHNPHPHIIAVDSYNHHRQPNQAQDTGRDMEVPRDHDLAGQMFQQNTQKNFTLCPGRFGTPQLSQGGAPRVPNRLVPLTELPQEPVNTVNLRCPIMMLKTSNQPTPEIHNSEYEGTNYVHFQNSTRLGAAHQEIHPGNHHMLEQHPSVFGAGSSMGAGPQHYLNHTLHNQQSSPHEFHQRQYIGNGGAGVLNSAHDAYFQGQDPVRGGTGIPPSAHNFYSQEQYPVRGDAGLSNFTQNLQVSGHYPGGRGAGVPHPTHIEYSQGQNPGMTEAYFHNSVSTPNFHLPGQGGGAGIPHSTHNFLSQGQDPVMRGAEIPNPSQFQGQFPVGGVAVQHQVPHQQLGPRTGDKYGAFIRQKEKDDIKAVLRPGCIIQVCGPPMAGKSTLVKQAIDERLAENASYHPPFPRIVSHHFECKKISTFDGILTKIMKKLFPVTLNSTPDEDYVLGNIRAPLEECRQCHHILVFHKCESLKSNRHSEHFVAFLARLVQEFSSTLTITVIFTTYQQFFTGGYEIPNIFIDLLTDIRDIMSLLQYYLPSVELKNYAYICQRTLCMPEAVRLIVEEYLAHSRCRVSPEVLEKRINTDRRYLDRLFGGRLREVEDWVSEEDLLSLVHFSHSIENSFTEAHLEYVSSDDDPINYEQLSCKLRQNFIVRDIHGIGRLVIHPLVVYYCMVKFHLGQERGNQVALQGYVYDHSCNRFTQFLGQLLMNTEARMRQHGRKGLVYGGLVQDWPNVRHFIEMALHCNENTYEAFLKVGISAAGIIMKCFTKEAPDFYLSMYNGACEYGHPRERAVLRAFLGQAIVQSGSGVAWHLADEHLSAAIESLSQHGNSFFLVWALNRKAMILHRQGKYTASLEYFRRSRQVLRQVDPSALGETFAVTDMQLEEEMITQEIQETIPIIFTGKNKQARERLDHLLQHINNRCENHPELATLLNLIGLTEERGNRNLDNAVRWYKLSYNERMYLAKMCPQNLLVSLNNIGMVLFRRGGLEEALKYLHKALEIRRECGWRHYYTALTLVHLCEIKMKLGDLPGAFRDATEADKILEDVVKDHDMRLRINLTLAHYRVVLRQQLEPQRCSSHSDVNRRTSDASSASSDNLSPIERARYCNPNADLSETRNIPHFDTLLGRGEGLSSDPVSHDFKSSALFQNGDGMAGAAAGATAAVQNTSRPNAFGEGDASTCCGGDAGVGTCHQLSGADPAILNVTMTQIDPVDLERSAEFYLHRLLNVVDEMTGTLSDDGHSYVLSAHEHIMLLNWGNSRQTFEKHKNAILRYMQDNPGVEETMFTADETADSAYRCLTAHRDLYSYIRDTQYEDLNLRDFIRFMIPTCRICGTNRVLYSEDMWIREMQHCIHSRNEKTKFWQKMDSMRINPNRFPDEASDVLSPDNAFGRSNARLEFSTNNQELRQTRHLHANINEHQTVEFSFTSGDQNSELHEAGIPYPQMWMSSAAARGGEPLITPLQGSSVIGSGNSSHLYVRQALNMESSSEQSVEENVSEVMSPRIIQDQRAIWEEITRRNKTRTTCPSHILTDLGSQNLQQPSSITTELSQRRVTESSDSVCTGDIMMSKEHVEVQNNLASASKQEVKKGSSGTKVILGASSETRRRPVEQDWTEDHPSTWQSSSTSHRSHLSVVSSEENEDYETRISIYEGHERDSALDEFYHRKTQIAVSGKEFNSGHSADPSETGEAERSGEMKSSYESVDQSTLEDSLSKLLPVLEGQGETSVESETSSPIKPENFSVFRYLQEAGFTIDMPVTDETENERSRSLIEYPQRLEQELAHLTVGIGESLSSHDESPAAHLAESLESQEEQQGSQTKDSEEPVPFSAATFPDINTIRKINLTVEDSDGSATSVAVTAINEPCVQVLSNKPEADRRCSDGLESAVGPESGLGSSRRSSSPSASLISESDALPERCRTQSASYLWNNDLLENTVCDKVPNLDSSCSHGTQGESGFQSQSVCGGALPKTRSPSNQDKQRTQSKEVFSSHDSFSASKNEKANSCNKGMSEIHNNNHIGNVTPLSQEPPDHNTGQNLKFDTVPIIHLENKTDRQQSSDQNSSQGLLEVKSPGVENSGLTIHSIERFLSSRSSSREPVEDSYMSEDNFVTVIPQSDVNGNSPSSVPQDTIRPELWKK